ncbi:hypothetical protein KY320_03665 [Candidatus Woesearchaeota archaeon]|nr:hypothetical protein [Candidatus Woesearchaeota archaeon]
MKKMNTRGIEFAWTKLANIILLLALLVVLIIGISFMRGYGFELWARISGFFRFGN